MRHLPLQERVVMATKPGPDADPTGSLAKGLRVLACFDADHPQLTAREIADRTGINRASIYRIIRTLETLGYVEGAGGTYAPTVRVLGLGQSAVESREPVHLVRPHLERLRDELTDATALSYGVLDGTDVVYVLRLVRKEIIAINLHVGSRLPCYLSSIGKSILAAMADEEREAVLARLHVEPHTRFTAHDISVVRQAVKRAGESGIAINDQELTVGLRSVAAPIMQGDQVQGAINVALPTTRATLEVLRDHYGRRLLAVAQEISSQLSQRAEALGYLPQGSSRAKEVPQSAER
jgi:IclR family transcriptional regulator, pca regulon regulatory protein